jgi:hypothetical protein
MHNTAIPPATQLVPFARKSRVRREPNVEPSWVPSEPNALLMPPPLLGWKSTMTINATDSTIVKITINKNMAESMIFV